MSLQAERITEACEALGLSGMANQYDALAQAAAKAESSYADYLEHCLKAEQQARRQRSRTVLVKMAGFLPSSCWTTMTSGSPWAHRKSRSRRLARWPSWNARRTSCCWAPAGWVKPTWPLRWGIWRLRPD